MNFECSAGAYHLLYASAGWTDDSSKTSKHGLAAKLNLLCGFSQLKLEYTYNLN